MAIYIVNSNGSITGPMQQPQAESYLYNVMGNDANRQASLKQALNDVSFDRGKATGTYKYDGKAVLHASSGDGAQSVSVFFYKKGDDSYIIAMGEHIKGKVTAYKLSDYGQKAGDFKEGAKITLS